MCTITKVERFGGGELAVSNITHRTILFKLGAPMNLYQVSDLSGIKFPDRAFGKNRTILSTRFIAVRNKYLTQSGWLYLHQYYGVVPNESY